jgi:hypothetical protein
MPQTQPSVPLVSTTRTTRHDSWDHHQSYRPLCNRGGADGGGHGQSTRVNESVAPMVNPFYERFAQRKYRSMGGQHSVSKTDDNQREALADFEAEQLRLQYATDVAF